MEERGSPVILPRSFVIDSSVVAGILLPDEESSLATAVRDQWTELTLVAPKVLRLEFLNVALSVRRRGRVNAEQFAELLLEGTRFPVTYDETDTPLLEFASRAYDLGLTSYDHAYVDCAHRRGLPLATLDHGMIRACATLGIPTVTNTSMLHEPRVEYVGAPAAKKAPRARTRAR